MAMAHPLNLAIALQILNDIRNGQLRSCLAMGFAEQDLRDFIEPQCMSVLVNAPVPWFKVVVDPVVLQRLLAQAKDREDEQLIDAALEQGGSSPLIHEVFGLTNKEISLRRTMLGIPNRKGRWPAISQAQERELWNAWSNLVKDCPIKTGDVRTRLKVAIQLSQRLPSLNLTMVWNTIQGWIEQDLL
jgi:hypothetical protein